jgi:DNA-binding NarL/FixJ family response regulator
VDDHRLVRQGIRLLLQADPEIEVIGEAANGDDAVIEAQLKHPDVVLMDLLMPGLDGVAAVAAIRRAVPRTEIVVLTSLHEDAGAIAAMRAGAIGYLVKDISETDLRLAIKAAASGEPLLSPEMTERLRREIQTTERREPLTERETEVLVRLAEGQANKEIAYELGIAETTVKSHVRSILVKTGAASRTQAALRATHIGLLPARILPGPKPNAPPSQR